MVETSSLLTSCRASPNNNFNSLCQPEDAVMNLEEAVETGIEKIGWKKRARQAFMKRNVEMEIVETENNNESSSRKRESMELETNTQQAAFKKPRHMFNPEKSLNQENMVRLLRQQ